MTVGITFTEITKVGDAAWRFRWPGVGTPPYRIYLDGREVFVPGGETPTFATEITLHHDDVEEPPELEVIDAATELPDNLINSPRGILQWRGNLQLSSYRVEEFVASVWTVRRNIPEDGSGYYQHETSALEDVTEALWRVVGLDSEGNETEPLAFTFFPVRNPPAPSITMTYSNPSLTFEAR